MKNLIFLGPPGAGKGTIAQQILEKLELIQISTGDLLRGAVKEGTEVGLKAKEYMDSGKLVPDELVVNILQERIKNDDCKNGFILDGFPRTIPQADSLSSSDVQIHKVINFTVPEEVIVYRLAARRTCKSCSKVYNINPDGFPQPKEHGRCDSCGSDLFQRDDDCEGTIRGRLKVYRDQTEPLIDYYKQKGILDSVDANRKEIAAIVNDALTAIEK
ncbi:adenylate kinase [Candidatus Woesearchaeota archaeon]|nr:adenylate kinase [Candidatus Woesearchaeota archaeon]